MKSNVLNLSLTRFFAGAFALLSVGLLSGCFEEPNEMAILDDTEVVIPLLTERIEAREDLSYFAAVLKGARMDAEIVDEKTDIAKPVTVNFWNTFSGYGTYTLFAPNNKAVQEWLSDEFPQIDSTSPATVQSGIAALDEDDMLKVTNTIQYHICSDSIPSKLFVIGKFPYPTLLGSFLLLSKDNAQLDGDADPRAYTVINKTAYMVSSDINAGNGYLHVLNKVLEPETRTISQIVSDLDDNKYSIFKSIFTDPSVTDMDSVLNVAYTVSTTESGRKVKNKVNYTLFVHSDAAFERFFRAAGILAYGNGIEALKSYLESHRQDGDERDIDELVGVWAKYHVLFGEYYINDLIKLCGARGTMTTTMADNETLGLKYLSGVIRLNRDDERQDDGSFDTGGRLFPDSYVNAHPEANLPYSDIGATNGVIHFVDKVYSMKVTKAKALFWDVADQALISTHPSYRNKNGAQITNKPDGTLIPDYFPDFKVTATWGAGAELVYEPAAGWDNSKTCHIYGDRITMQIGGNRIRGLDITTPSLNKGRYYLWFCFRHQGSGTCGVVLTHNGTPNKRTTYFDFWGAKSESDPVNAGYKEFTVKAYQMSCHLIGQINVTANGPQVLSLDIDTRGSNGLGAWLDMIQFIPIDDNQAWPRFDACGIAYYETPSKYYTDPWNCPVQEVDDDEEPLPED